MSEEDLDDVFGEKEWQENWNSAMNKVHRNEWDGESRGVKGKGRTWDFVADDLKT